TAHVILLLHSSLFFFMDPATPHIYTLSLHDALPISLGHERALFIGSDAPSLTVSDLLAAHTALDAADVVLAPARDGGVTLMGSRSEEHTSELQSRFDLVCRLLLEKKKLSVYKNQSNK